MMIVRFRLKRKKSEYVGFGNGNSDLMGLFVVIEIRLVEMAVVGQYMCYLTDGNDKGVRVGNPEPETRDRSGLTDGMAKIRGR